VLSTKTLTATISFSSIANLNVLGGQSGNVFDVLATGSGTPLMVNAGQGNDTVNVGSAGNAVDGIQGPLAINGGGGVDTLNYNDQGATATVAWSYTITSNSLQRNNLPMVMYSGMTTLNISLASALPSYIVPEVESTAAGTTYNIFGGPGENEYFIGDNQDTLNGIAGPVFLHSAGDGQGNDNLLFLFDSNNQNSESFLLGAGASAESGLVQRSSAAGGLPDMAPISFAGINGYAILEAGPAASVNIVSVSPSLLETILAGNGDVVTIGSQAPALGGNLVNIAGDVGIQSYSGQSPPSVVIDDSSDTTSRTADLSSLSYAYEISGLGNSSSGRGRFLFTVSPAAPVSIYAGAGNDTFRFEDFTLAPALTLAGGSGTNTLDYSAYAGPVTVDLAKGTATGLAGFSNFQNVIGNGNTQILADVQASILTAVPSSSSSKDHLAIPGSTNPAALERIMRDWAQSVDIETRMTGVQQIFDFLDDSGYKLDLSTLISDGLANAINPGPAGNWIIP
jgi:hypothetical protein